MPGMSFSNWLVVGVLVILIGACSDSGEETGTTTSDGQPAETPPNSTRVDGAPQLGATTTEVAIPAAGLTLEGSLRLPAREEGTVVPAVVLIHGSGPVDRDARIPGQVGMQFGFNVPVFAELGDGLQDHGFAVVTYDKRTCGSFNGCRDNDYPVPEDDLTIGTFLADARAAVAWLREQPAVDSERLAVIGHSQGAQFITTILADDPAVAAGVMIAGPFRPIDQIIESQRDRIVDLLVELGASRDAAAASPSVTPISELVEGLGAIRAGGDEPVGGVDAEFWRGWFALDEASVSKAAVITQPLLVVNGDLDWNVPAAEAEAWRAHLSEVGKTEGQDFVVRVFPCLTHALNCVDETDPVAMTPADIGREVSDDVVVAIAGFLDR